MSIEVKGEDAVIRELERRLTGARALAIQDRALMAGAKVFVEELRRQFESFKDTGASLKEMTIGNPETVGGQRRISIFWKGPKNRFRIIHLNEFGTVNNPNPAGKGAIARAMRNAERAYRNVVKRELEALTRG